MKSLFRYTVATCKCDIIIYINDIPNVSQIAKFILYADDANVINTGNNITEVDAQLRDLCKIILKWVDSRDYCLKLKKTKYMIFFEQGT